MLGLLASISLTFQPAGFLIQGGTVYDGSGGAGRRVDVRIRGAVITEVGRLKPKAGEVVLHVRGLAVAPGFIDAHSHADGGVITEPTAESQVRQGITTAVVGQDGGWKKPVSQYLGELARARPAINFAMFSGHGGIREKVMGKDFERSATKAEVGRMTELVEADMRAGALGLSTGLEYNPGFYASTEEIVSMSAPVAKYDGMYISHVRDEGHRVFDSFSEVAGISAQAGIPAQISHIKLAVSSVWGSANRAVKSLRASTLLTADVYPYLYWQSTIRVLTNSRDWGNRRVWVDALKDVGGPQNVRLTTYSVRPSWVGKTLAQISALTGKEPPDLIMEIIEATKDGKGSESIVCQAMIEADLRQFIAHPRVMFCSDGSIGGTHPRGAGSFPRILGLYVRELKVLSLQEAIRKMTSFPARRFRLAGRGLLQKSFVADVVVFDPKQIRDLATPEKPRTFSVGVVHVFVNGRPVLRSGKITGERSGKALRRG